MLTATWDTFLMKHRFSAEHCLHRKIRKRIERGVKKKLMQFNNYSNMVDSIRKAAMKEKDYVMKLTERTLEFSDKK